jgi:hypothetical protein
MLFISSALVRRVIAYYFLIASDAAARQLAKMASRQRSGEPLEVWQRRPLYRTPPGNDELYHCFRCRAGPTPFFVRPGAIMAVAGVILPILGEGRPKAWAEATALAALFGWASVAIY